MATFKTTHYAQQETAAGNMGRQVKVPSGTLEFRAVEYTLAGTEETAGDLIYIGQLPVGVKVVPTLCSVVCENPGTLVMNIGTVEDPDMLAQGLTLTGGGRKEFTSGTIPAGALTLPSLASTNVYATLTGSPDPTVGAKLVFNLAWMTAR